MVNNIKRRSLEHGELNEPNVRHLLIDPRKAKNYYLLLNRDSIIPGTVKDIIPSWVQVIPNGEYSVHTNTIRGFRA